MVYIQTVPCIHHIHFQLHAHERSEQALALALRHGMVCNGERAKKKQQQKNIGIPCMFWAVCSVVDSIVRFELVEIEPLR